MISAQAVKAQAKQMHAERGCLALRGDGPGKSKNTTTKYSLPSKWTNFRHAALKQHCKDAQGHLNELASE
jgi:hypothetical protein